MAFAETDGVIRITHAGHAGTHEKLKAEEQGDRQLAFLAARATAIAWVSILAGALSGMLMGLWAFDGPFPVPSWIGEYDALPRRFLRLAHVAMFALGGLHILVAGQLRRATMPLAHRKTAYLTMAAGNILMPTVLIAAAVWEPFKYLTAAPATALTIAIGMVAGDAVRAMRRV